VIKSSVIAEFIIFMAILALLGHDSRRRKKTRTWMVCSIRQINLKETFRVTVKTSCTIIPIVNNVAIYSSWSRISTFCVGIGNSSLLVASIGYPVARETMMSGLLSRSTIKIDLFPSVDENRSGFSKLIYISSS
jgi:hypothetical protein